MRGIAAVKNASDDIDNPPLATEHHTVTVFHRGKGGTKATNARSMTHRTHSNARQRVQCGAAVVTGCPQREIISKLGHLDLIWYNPVSGAENLLFHESSSRGNVISCNIAVYVVCSDEIESLLSLWITALYTLLSGLNISHQEKVKILKLTSDDLKFYLSKTTKNWNGINPRQFVLKLP
jgi:hypothetical protein